MGIILQKAVRDQDRELLINDDLDVDCNNIDERWYDELVDDTNISDGDDEVIDEKVVMLSIYEVEPVLSRSSTISILTNNISDGEGESDSNDGHVGKVNVYNMMCGGYNDDNSNAGMSYESSFIYPDLLLIRAILKMMWNLLIVESYDVVYRRKVSAWMGSMEVGALPIDITHKIIDERVRVVVDNIRDGNNKGVYKGDDNTSFGQNNHVYRGVKLSRVAREDPVIMLYYNLLLSGHSTKDGV